MKWQDFYERGKWRGIDNYQCLVCPYATTGGVEDILAHVAGHFPADLKRELSGNDVLDTAEAADEEE